MFATIKPPSCIPKKAMNKPIPEEMANFRSEGIALIIISRNLNIVIKIKMIDATKTAAKAVSHETCMPMQTV